MEKTKRSTAEKIRNYKRPFGTSSVADQERIVCIPDKLRIHHVHVIGRSIGSKTTLIERMAINDIKTGHSVAIIDPHGDMVEELLDASPPGSQDNQAAR